MHASNLKLHTPHIVNVQQRVACATATSCPIWLKLSCYPLWQWWKLCWQPERKLPVKLVTYGEGMRVWKATGEWAIDNVIADLA